MPAISVDERHVRGTNAAKVSNCTNSVKEISFWQQRQLTGADTSSRWFGVGPRSWCGPERLYVRGSRYRSPFRGFYPTCIALQLYRDVARGSVEELQEKVIFGEGGHLVEALRACRLSPDTHRWEILVKRFGLDDIEASWEPAEVIIQDVPLLFEAFITVSPGDPQLARLVTALQSTERHRRVPAARRLPRRRAAGTRQAVHSHNRSRLEGEVICPGAIIQHRQLGAQAAAIWTSGRSQVRSCQTQIDRET
ncbi:hypothetical protein PR003_g7645 [Phytophthora rubi]|uniref:Chromo domain-containing protein n=1 Tax=Phytophthora rubi TaxID=129364 RepID=A0A6A4FLA2_9STRA|nr:hypothetical protein PR003_g7645 [Phytophthora rubi]